MRFVTEIPVLSGDFNGEGAGGTIINRRRCRGWGAKGNDTFSPPPSRTFSGSL